MAMVGSCPDQLAGEQTVLLQHDPKWHAFSPPPSQDWLLRGHVLRSAVVLLFIILAAMQVAVWSWLMLFSGRPT